MSKKQDPITVSNVIILDSLFGNDRPFVTYLRLQKYLYILSREYQKMYGERLFEERFKYSSRFGKYLESVEKKFSLQKQDFGRLHPTSYKTVLPIEVDELIEWLLEEYKDVGDFELTDITKDMIREEYGIEEEEGLIAEFKRLFSTIREYFSYFGR